MQIIKQEREISTPEDKKSFKYFFPLAALLIISGIILRAWAARGDLWLDEVWTIALVNAFVSSPMDIITNLHHDNNHILNTFYIYLLGDNRAFFWYRLPAVIFGSAVIALMPVALGKGKEKTAVFAIFLTAISYPLILYSSEARGFGPALFFSLSAFILLKKYLKIKALSLLVLYWAASVFGLLSHLSFIYIFISLLAWSAFVFFQDNKKNPAWCLIKIHGPVAAFIAALWLIHIRHIIFGGGPIYSLFKVVGRAMALALGGPMQGLMYIPAIVLFIVAAIYGIIILEKKQNNLWMFFVFAIFFSPGLVIIITRPEYLYFRYFLVCIPFFYILFSHVLSNLWNKNIFFRVMIIFFLFFYAGGNIIQLDGLYRLKRGSYKEAMLFMAQHEKGKKIYVGSNNDLSTLKLLPFYSRFMPPGKEFIYAGDGLNAEKLPRWFILSTLNKISNLEFSKYIPGKGRYRLKAMFLNHQISGCSWYIYELEG